MVEPILIADGHGQLRAPRLLVVEDNEFCLELALRWLKRYGYEHVDGARDGLEGLERYGLGGHDILWIDYSLPELDGVTMVERMEVPVSGRRPWIVLFTAADAGRIERWMSLGLFDDVLRKPCATPEYAQCMDRALRGLRARRAELGVAR
jgi:CheY-like chemotaxis protein